MIDGQKMEPLMINLILIIPKINMKDLAMPKELFDKVQSFEKKYAIELIEWLTLVRNQQNNHAWPPRTNDSYAWAQYHASCEHDSNLKEFEDKVDKNILLTYMKYHTDIRVSYTFLYIEPKIDLVLIKNKTNVRNKNS